MRVKKAERRRHEDGDKPVEDRKETGLRRKAKAMIKTSRATN